MTRKNPANSKHQDRTYFNDNEMSEIDIENDQPYSNKSGNENLKFNKAVKSLLELDMGVIPLTILMRQIDNDAANLLVEHGILIYVDDLFMESDDWDSGGFIKYIPEQLDLVFSARLLRFGFQPSMWKRTFCVPDVWKSRLSEHGIKTLCEMAIYRQQLDLPPEPSLVLVSGISLRSNLSQTNLSVGSKSNGNNLLDSNTKNSNSIKKAIEKTFIDVTKNKDVKRSNDSKEYTTGEKLSFKRLRIDQSSLHCNSQSHHPSLLLNTLTVDVNWHQSHGKVVGFRNRTGNDSCVNAAIQCLSHSPVFVDWLLTDRYGSISCPLSDKGEFCSVCTLAKAIQLIHSISNDDQLFLKHTVNTYAEAINSHLEKLSWEFIRNDQEDSSPFIQKLLNYCADCLTPSTQRMPKSERPITVIDQIFSMNSLSTIECLSCFTTNEQEEVNYIISVEVGDIHSVSEALECYFRQELLAGENAHYCSTCNDLVKARKRLAIHVLPPILMINFKRNTSVNNFTPQFVHLVHYDEFLDMSSYLTTLLLNQTNSNQKTTEFNESLYRLYAVIVHSGFKLKSNHFFAYFRTSENTWVKVDDENCQRVLLKDVLNNKAAFTLFYSKSINSNTDTSKSLSLQSIQSTLSQNEVVENDISSCRVLISEKTSSIIVHPIKDSVKQQSNEYSSSLSSENSKLQNASAADTEPFSNYSSNADFRNGFFGATPPPGYTESSITIEKRSNALEQPAIFEDDSDENSEQSDTVALHQHEIQKVQHKKLASVATGADIGEVFEQRLATAYEFRLTKSDLVKMTNIRQSELKKKTDARLKALGLEPDLPPIKVIFRSKCNTIPLNDITNQKSESDKVDSFSKRKVDIEYLNILLPYLKHYNSACGLCVRTRYFGKNTSKPTSLLVRCVLKCSGSICSFKCAVNIFNSGTCFIVASNSKIFHIVNERIKRPIRGSRRREIIEKFKAGGLLYRVHAQYTKQRTMKEKLGFNYDATGVSKKVFKKIKAESVAETLLAPDVQIGIEKLYDQLTGEVNNNGVIKGILQLYQIRPFCIVAFMEASIRLYDALVEKPDTVFSWDATGGIVKAQQSSTKQLLYYELTLAHPNIVDEDSLIPLTFMLSESQSLTTVVQWLTLFKDGYKKIFPHKKNAFPRPAIILSDRAQVFLQGALRVFNEENYEQFLSRAYRIVTNQSSKDDLTKTNIHACLSHFMLDMRKLVNRCLPDEIREIGMWSMALLVNTNTWNEMRNHWRLICLVFWNYYTTENENVKRYHSDLLSRIERITNDLNTTQAITCSRSLSTHSIDEYEYEDDHELTLSSQSLGISSANAKNTRKRLSNSRINHSIIDEEQELNQIDSSFKNDLKIIFDECCRKDSQAHKTSSSTNKLTKGARDWLIYVMKNYIPTVPIWSNLLLGNCSRHSTSSVRAFDRLLLSTHDQRTNSISERRMCIVKRTQLGTQTHIRPDVVLQILTEDMQRMTESFSLSLLVRSMENGSSIQRQQLKEISEHWNRSNHRGQGRYTKKPSPTVMINLQSTLVAALSTINNDLTLPNLSAPTWLNLSIGLLLSTKSIRQSPPRSSSMKSSFLIDVVGFIENWSLQLINIGTIKRRSTAQKRLLDSKFDIPTNVPHHSIEQPIFLLQNILLPIIAQPMVAIKTYTCTACKFTVSKYVMIDYISIGLSENQLLFRNELQNYFKNSTSDIICEKCSFSMNRRTELLDCPNIVVVTVNGTAATSFISRKPPHTLCFDTFMHSSSVACPSSTIFDIVGFLSVVPTSVDHKLELVTRIKQRWRVSSTQKLIGDGDQLCQFFARSRIIILERLRESDTNFLMAIAQCCSISNIDMDSFAGSFKTLREAVKQIETNPALQVLQLTISSAYTNFYQCQNCYSTSHLLSSTYECVSLYQQVTRDSIVTAAPFIWNDKNLNQQCTNCMKHTGNLIMNPYEQTHQYCPFILMFQTERTTRGEMINIRVSLMDDSTRSRQIYKVISALLIDRYNSISVVKLGALNDFMVYCQTPYIVSTSLSENEVDDLFVTTRSVILFFQKIDDNDDNNHSIVSSCVANKINNRTNMVPTDIASQLPNQNETEQEKMDVQICAETGMKEKFTPTTLSKKTIVLQKPFTVRLAHSSSSNPRNQSIPQLIITSTNKSTVLP